MLLSFSTFFLLTFFCCLSSSSAALEVVWTRAELLDDDLVWRPVLPSSDYFVIGQYVNRSVESRNFVNSEYECNERSRCWNQRIPIARATGDELIPPIEFQQILVYKNMVFWKLKCPENYVALSGIATLQNPTTRTQLPPERETHRCVHHKFVERLPLYFYFHANGRIGLWALPVTDRSVGSFFILSEPDNDTHSATGYQLTVQASDVENLAEIQATTARISRLEQITAVADSLPITTGSHIYDTTSTQAGQLNSLARDRVVLIASAAVIASSIIASVILFVYCLKYRKKLKIILQESESSNAELTPEFEFTSSLQAPPSRRNITSHNSTRSEREMRINMLYEDHHCNETL